jgi:hypothetical protein
MASAAKVVRLSPSVEPLETTRTVTRAACEQMFLTLVNYVRGKSRDADDMDARLVSIGLTMGRRLLEMNDYRSGTYRLLTKLSAVLSFVAYDVWQLLYGKPADSLEQSADDSYCFMIVESQSFLSQFATDSDGQRQFDPSAFNVGLVRAGLEHCGLFADSFGTHIRQAEGSTGQQLVIVIELSPLSVLNWQQQKA